MSSSMRILRLTPMLYREGVWPVAYDPLGGLQTQVWRLTKALEKAGVSQTVLTSHIPGHTRSTRHSNNLEVLSIGTSLPRFAARFVAVTWFLSVIRHLLANRASYDLVHIHFDHRIWPRVLTIFTRRFNLPVVVSLNTELWVSSKCRWLLANKHFNVSQRIERWAIRSADKAFALTLPDAARWNLQIKPINEKITVIPDAIDVDSYASTIDEKTKDAFRRAHQIPPNKKVVAYIGRIRSEKGWQDLPTITSELSEAGKFVLICGDGPDRKKLTKKLQELSCDDAWEITGFIAPAEIRIALQIADVVILPSRREAFGSVLLEAMASAVPAVAYAVGGIVDVAGTPNAIRLVPSRDKIAFVQAIKELLTNAEQHSYFVEQGLLRVKDFSLKHAAWETYYCYRNLLGDDNSNNRESNAFVGIET